MFIRKASDKEYVLGKALSSNAYETDTVSSLAGLSDKGIIFQSGTELESDGDDGSSLVSTSADTHALAHGYNIHEPVEMSSDKAFQTKLKGTTSSEETFDVVNGLLDFTVLGLTASDNFTLVELAPYVPLTLGRVDNNPANTTDTTFTKIGTSGAATNTRTIPCSFDSSITIPNIGEDIYEIQSDSSYRFLGKFLYFRSSVGGDSNIFLDRPATASGSLSLYILADKDATRYEKDKLNHNLNLVNGAHLHGGKVIGLLNPLTISSPATGNTPNMLFESIYSFNSTTDLTYTKKYGSPYYRIFNMQKGNFAPFLPRRTTLLENFDTHYYYKTPSAIKYYADAYRFDPGYYYSSGFEDGITGIGKAAGNENHLLYESQGYQPASGSRFFDTKFHESGGSASVVPFTRVISVLGSLGNFSAMDALEQPDPKAARLFLFINTDLEPYSGKRKDSILNTSVTRNLVNYELTLLKETRDLGNIYNKWKQRF